MVHKPYQAPQGMIFQVFKKHSSVLERCISSLSRNDFTLKICRGQGEEAGVYYCYQGIGCPPPVMQPWEKSSRPGRSSWSPAMLGTPEEFISTAECRKGLCAWLSRKSKEHGDLCSVQTLPHKEDVADFHRFLELCKFYSFFFSIWM